MKNIRLITAAGLAAMLSFASHADPSPQTPTFTVSITLTPTCQAVTVSNIAMTYVGFATALESSSGGEFTMTCTNGMAYTFALDDDGGAAAGTATARQYTDDATLFGYTLTTPSTSNTGTGSAQSKQIVATKTTATPLGFTCTQNSTTGCNNSLATNRTRTLTVSY
jgi:spore coat protein U-like protein